MRPDVDCLIVASKNSFGQRTESSISDAVPSYQIWVVSVVKRELIICAYEGTIRMFKAQIKMSFSNLLVKPLSLAHCETAL